MCRRTQNIKSCEITIPLFNSNGPCPGAPGSWTCPKCPCAGAMHHISSFAHFISFLSFSLAFPPPFTSKPACVWIDYGDVRKQSAFTLLSLWHEQNHFGGEKESITKKKLCLCFVILEKCILSHSSPF